MILFFSCSTIADNPGWYPTDPLCVFFIWDAPWKLPDNSRLTDRVSDKTYIRVYLFPMRLWRLVCCHPVGDIYYISSWLDQSRLDPFRLSHICPFSFIFSSSSGVKYSGSSLWIFLLFSLEVVSLIVDSLYLLSQIKISTLPDVSSGTSEAIIVYSSIFLVAMVILVLAHL